MLGVAILMVVVTLFTGFVEYQSDSITVKFADESGTVISENSGEISQPRVGVISCSFIVPAKKTRSYRAGIGGFEVIAGSALSLEVQITSTETSLPEEAQEKSEWVWEFDNANSQRGAQLFNKRAQLQIAVIVSEGQYLEFINGDSKPHHGYFAAKYPSTQVSQTSAYPMPC